MSQYTKGTEEPVGREFDEEGLGGDEGREDKKEEKAKPKSKFQEFLNKARTNPFFNQTLEEKSKPQNIFANLHHVVFPDSLSLLSDVLGTPIGMRHFGPVPIRHVMRQNKTTKQVPLTNRNLVLDLPVLLKLVLPCTGHPEVMKTRYTAVTCNPDDFEKNSHFLHQNQMNRCTELFICITMFNVSGWASCMAPDQRV
jgi:Chitin synthase N-terminal